MKKNLSLILVFFIILLFFYTKYERTHTEKVYAHLMSKDLILSNDNVLFFTSTRALVDEVQSNKPDFIIISAIDYILHFRALNDYRALYSMHFNRYLHSDDFQKNIIPRVGILKSSIEYYLVDQNLSKHQIYLFDTQKEIDIAYSEGLISHKVTGESSALYPNTLESLGVNEMLVLIKIKPKPTKDKIVFFEKQYLPKHALEPPSPAALNESVRWLLMNQHIQTRYYYDDLVISP